MKKIFLLYFIGASLFAGASSVKEFSTAGFYSLAGSTRTVYSMNPAWKFYKGDIAGAENVDFDDSAWAGVNLPNGIELLPVIASGGVNYRGSVWYRKHFELSSTDISRRQLLHFEAIMGKCKIWVNGAQVAHHFGGYTPIEVDVTNHLKDGANVIAVWADNSDDESYPPGKVQYMLDFSYFGGIYRDVWLIGTDSKNYIKDSYIYTSELSGSGALIGIETALNAARGAVVEFELLDNRENVVDSWRSAVVNDSVKSTRRVKNPQLWSPQNPHLYKLNIRLKAGGRVVDGYSEKIGIRTIEFNTAQGFVLNGKPYGKKLIGANRHQDFAVVGNSVSNNLHYRDAAKLRDAGMDIVRNAHYPQDPAFMDACDELGLFVIENTPGWQFWNEDPIFANRVFADIAAIVRRDRNRPSVILWEPILNETWYPEDFAEKTHNAVKKHIPHGNSAYTAADATARGAQYFDLIYNHPADAADSTIVQFNREWGDFVDDWNSQNSRSRAARNWGETAQLIQAIHYANPLYANTSYAKLLAAPTHHIGGTLWHSFDHQRGYHPDPFYGGIADAMRRPKYSYYMFQAQSDAVAPMIFIANELTPFSPSDITIFSNCAAVRLYTPYNRDSVMIKKRSGMWFVFDGGWNFVADKDLSDAGERSKCFIKAEGLSEAGDVLCSTVIAPARRPAKIELVVDTMSAGVVATGGDLVVVTAKITDEAGNVKRLNNQYIRFSVEGQGVIAATTATATNPAPVQWGEASVIIRTTTTPGAIKVKAEVLMQGENTPKSASVEFSSAAARYPMIYDKSLIISPYETVGTAQNRDLTDKQREEVAAKLKIVEQQQADFGEKN